MWKTSKFDPCLPAAFFQELLKTIKRKWLHMRLVLKINRVKMDKLKICGSEIHFGWEIHFGSKFHFASIFHFASEIMVQKSLMVQKIFWIILRWKDGLIWKARKCHLEWFQMIMRSRSRSWRWSISSWTLCPTFSLSFSVNNNFKRSSIHFPCIMMTLPPLIIIG